MSIPCACIPCLNYFEPKTKAQKYCCRYCQIRSKWLRHGPLRRAKGKHIEISCAGCNQACLVWRASQKYCSKECADKAKIKYHGIPDCFENSHRKIDKNIGYVRLYCPMHKEANSRGYVYEHRIVAELLLGRPLEVNEIVHHRNGKRWDNRRENLQVMDRLEHSKIVNKPYEYTGEPVPAFDDDIMDLLTQKYGYHQRVVKKYFCTVCGISTNRRKFCKPCYTIERRKVKNRPSKDELQKLISEKSFVEIGRMYGVSDNAIRKWRKE